ncbi:MAG: efflux RND transporter periplasmic adaptor subunit [Bacillota bacterium]
MQFVKKYWLWIVVIVVIIGIIGSTWYFISARRKAQAQPSDTMTVKVQRGDLEELVSGTGSIEAAVQEEIRTRISSSIAGFYMSDGQQVTAGQLLAELEADDLSLQIERKRLDIAISERDYNKLRQQLTPTVIKAPSAGEVTWLVKENSRVQEDAVIATVLDRSIMEVTGSFNSAQLADIRVGQKAEVFLPDFLTSVPAQVVQVNSDAKAGESGAILYEVKVEFKNPGGLDLGMKASLKVFTPNGEKQAVTTGNLMSGSSTDIRAPIAGRIVRVKVDSGRTVQEGGALAEIENPDPEQLNDNIATAGLRLQQLKLDLLELEQKQLERKQNMKILAPFDGTISLPSQAKGVGDDVSQGTVLATIIDYSKIQVVIPVDELDIFKIKVGQNVRISADALPNIPITGQVVKIASHGRSQSGVATFDVTVAVEPVEGLRVGMTVNTDILVEQKLNTLLVPIEAVNRRQGRATVLVADKSEGNGSDVQTRPVQVTTGAYNASFIEILEGLEEGQEVVIQGAAARSGVPVIIPGMGGVGGQRPSGYQGGGAPTQQRGGGN